MAKIPQHDGWEVIYGTTTGMYPERVATWIEYAIGEQFNDSNKVSRIITVYFYGAVKDGYTNGTSSAAGLTTTFSVNGVDGNDTVNKGPVEFKDSNDIRLYGWKDVKIQCDQTGGTVKVPVVGTATIAGVTAITGGTIDTTIEVPFEAVIYPFNLNILLPDGSEPYSTGEAGTVDVSTDGGLTWYEDQKNEPNEGNSFYPYGTAFKFKDFKPGTGLRLSSVDVSTDGGLTWSGATQNADGTWSATQGAAELIVKFHTEKNDYGLDVNAELDGAYTQVPDGRYGTFSVKINGATVAENMVDYFEYHPYGSTYEICQVSASKGRRYLGCNLSAGVGPSGTIPDRDIEVILQFETIRYSISYVLGGGTNPGNASTSYTVDDAVTLPMPTRSGYEFTGWRDEGGSIVTGIPAGSTGDKTFIATWKPKAEMFAKDVDHYRRGLAKVKHKSKWREGTLIYKKINGHWKAKN